jgi:putative addiction module killer protein
VYEIRRSTQFDAWLTNLNDSNARPRIAARIDRLALGNPGDVKPVGSGVSEMRIDYSPGYRAYYARTDRVVYLLLCGGTKAAQDADIKLAIDMNAASPRGFGCSAKAEEEEVMYGDSNSKDREIYSLRFYRLPQDSGGCGRIPGCRL